MIRTLSRTERGRDRFQHSPVRAARLFLLAVPFLFLGPSQAFAVDYYVSPGGNDANSGTSSGSAWRTIGKVNTRNFAAGDRILFQGGQSFSGGLYFDAADAGAAANPITVSTYGVGNATINAGAADGLFAYNTAGIVISNLTVVGPGAGATTKTGISFYNDLPGNVRLQRVHMDNVDVSGFRHGIMIGAWNGTSGYNDVRVTNCAGHHNQRSGLSTYAAALYGLTNVYVGHCRFNDNLGDSSLAQPSGNGIVLGEVDGGVIERVVAYNNGINSMPGQGPVGIWAYNSNQIAIQFCESYANRTIGNTDGGGFDLDIAMTNSVMQYNYSHDNDGAGYGLYQGSTSAPWNNNVVRYNISENDGRKNGYGAITAWTGGASFSNADIYGNTIYVTPGTSAARAVRFNSPSTNFRFRNNLILSSGGARLVEVPTGQTGIVFQGNNYWSYGGAFSIHYNGINYTSLSAFSNATGQEKLGSVLVGKNVDPLLNAVGTGGTIGNADLLDTLAAYRVQSASPMIDAGLDLAVQFGINPGPRDYYGTLLPQGAGYDIGADEESGSTPPNQPPDVTAASANPASVTGTTTNITAVATDDRGETALIYTWSVVSAPSGASVSFSPNGTNTAKNSTATFNRAGSYVLRVTATDAGGLTDTFDVSVAVAQSMTSIGVTPATASILIGATKQYTALARDQFGGAMSVQPTFTWTITGAQNTITQSGLATAGNKAGTFTGTAAAGGKTGTATLRVTRR